MHPANLCLTALCVLATSLFAGEAEAAKGVPNSSLPSTNATVPQQVAAPQTWTLTIGGITRTALVFAPQQAQPNGGPAPLIFGFHGHGGSARGMINLMGFQKLWPQAVVIYPQGILTPNKRDPQGTKTGWQAEPDTYGDRDLAFYDALLAKAKASFRVDTKRIYVAGFSNGANFSYLLWGERASEIAAFAIAAGEVYPPLTLTVPRALFEMAGKTDPIAPFADQMRTDQMVEGLDGTGTGQQCGSNCTVYSAPSGLQVRVVIHPGGHLYPTAQSANVVAFFTAHPIP